MEEKEISINMWHNELSVHVPCVSASGNLADLSRCFSVKIDIIIFNVNALQDNTELCRNNCETFEESFVKRKLSAIFDSTVVFEGWILYGTTKRIISS